MAAIASLFPWHAEPVRADLDTSNSLHWILNANDPNPYTSIIGSGPNTPSGYPGYALTILAGATAFPTGSNPAISVSDDWTVYVYGTVQNQANGGGGLWNAGPNTIESRSNTTVVINEGAQVLATGNASNGEAINFIGNYNVIENHGLVQSRTGAAIWFQDTVTSPANSNTVHNYGTIRTLRGSNSSAIGNSGNNGVVFVNHTGALVDGGLSFAGGDDELTFEPDSNVTGSINGGGGTNSLVLQGTAGSSDSLAGAIQNFTTLTKTGEGEWTITGSLTGFTTVSIVEGTLRLTGDNTGYNGSVVINSSDYFPDATLEAKARSLPTTSSNVGNITNNGILRFVDSRSDDDGGIGNYTGQIIGSGLVEVAGDGIVTLTNTNNTYSGGTYIRNGTLNVISDATLGAAGGAIVLGDGTPGHSPTAGTLQFGAAFNLGSTRSIQTEGIGGTIDTNGFDTTISQGITGGTVTKAGAGTLTLTGKNEYVGGTYITDGTLQVGNGGTSGSIHYDGIISITGATAALAINRSDDVNIPTRLVGAGKFIQRGTGTTTLTGMNAYGGGTDIESGILAVQSNLNLGSGGPMSFGTATTRGTLRMDGNVDLNGRNVSLNAGGGTIDTQGFQGSSSGVITGVGGLTKAGTGTLTLTGNSTYTGGTTIAQGALQLGDGGTSGSIVGNVSNNGSLIFNRSDNVNSLALSGNISGNGNLIQRGTGTTTLSGGNSYSGGTVIENGTLAVNSDAALGAASGSLTFGTATTNGTLKLTADIDDLAKQRNVTLQNGGGTIDTGGYHGTTGANIQGTGHFTKTGNGILTLTADNDFSGGTTVRGGELELGDNRAGGVGSVKGNVEVQDTGTVVYNRADNNTDPAGTVWGSGNVIQRGSGVTTITNANTYTGSTTLQGGTLAISRDANLGNGGAVIFDGGKLQLNSNLTDFNSSRQVTLQSSGTIDTLGNTGTIGAVINGSGTLTKAGTGELILTGENTYTGNTTIASGTLRIGNGGATGSIVGNVANSGTLIFDRTGSVTYPGVISGTGNVIQRGGNSKDGTTIFTGNSTYTGGTTIESGTLQLGAGGTSGNIVGNVDNNGVLAFNRSDTFQFTGTISGTGAVNQIGTGTTILTANNSYTGGTNISQGALQLGACGPNGWITGNVALSNGGKLIFSNSVDKTGANAFVGLISGNGSIVKSCVNQLELTANNTFTGGTELQQGGILMTNAASLGTMTDGDSLAGHVWYSTVVGDPNADRTFEVSGDVNQIKNHFHVSAGAKNVFQANGDLTVSGITNNSAQQNLGGAFYIAGGASLDLNVGRSGQGNIDLTFENNRYGTTLNDFYLDSYGILNLNLDGADHTSTGNAVFIDSGIGGQGTMNVNGPGLVQISKDSKADKTFVTGAGMRLVGGMSFKNTIYTQDTQSSLQGNGFIDVSGSPRGSITISGTIRPDNATFTKGEDIVGRANRFGTLTLTGGTTELNTFTFAYDVAGPTSAGFTNDLVMFGSQDVKISDGTIDFVTLGSAGLTTGRYLVFSSDSSSYMDQSGAVLTDGTLNQVLRGTVNGRTLDTGSPRIDYGFEFGDYNGRSKNQIWFDVERNTLQTVWQGGTGDWQTGNWKSIQHNGTVYANDFNDGDLAIFNNAPSGRQTATLGSDIIVSGLQINTVVNNTTIADIEITGNGGISAKKSDPSIEGKYANGAANQDDRFDTTGKLEMRGIGGGTNLTTLTISNIGMNAFEEGIDLYGGKIALNGPDNRLGTYGNVTDHANAGLVTFFDDGVAGSQRVLEITGQNQSLQNKFVVSDNLGNNSIVATGVNATISNAAGVTTDVIALGAGSALSIDGTGNVIVQSQMTGKAGSKLSKIGTGTLQIEADSYADQTTVAGGIFRVSKNATYGNADSSVFNVDANGIAAGAGTVRANQINVRGTISPDNLDAADATKGSRYGTLTFNAVGASPSIVMNGFTLDFDVTGPTLLVGGNPANDQDLLVLNGVTVNDGTDALKGNVAFRTDGGVFSRGDYLVIKSSNGYNLSGTGIDGVHGTGALTATINGRNAAEMILTPRKTIKFELRNGATTDSDVWITNEMNSLTMDWTGTGTSAAPTGGDWVYTGPRMESAQNDAINRETYFLNGDKVHLYASNDAVTVGLAEGITPMVSGLVVGRKSGINGTDGTIYNGNVTIDGKGGITADKTTAFGDYLLPGVGGQPILTPTGKLEKYGTGTLTVANTGGNRFLDGTDLYSGRIVIGHRTALGAVDGNGTSLDGYVFFTGVDAVTRTVEVADTVESLQNHFRAVTIAGVNTFGNKGNLTISGVANNNAATPFGGAFFVEENSNLTIDAGGDLTLTDNGYNAGTGPVVNDIYLSEESELNVNVADGAGMFVGSGIDGDGKVVLNGSGTGGFLQIAADSRVNQTEVQSGRLRLVGGTTTYDHFVMFTLNSDAFLEGNGILKAVDGHVIKGIVTPDGATFAKGTDTVGTDEKIGVLRIQGGRTDFDGFTFLYDVVAPNTTGNPADSPNDLIRLASQDAYIHSGTIDFRMENGTDLLTNGKYLIIDSVGATFMDGDGNLLDNTTLNTVLNGQINGTAFEQLSSRNWCEFYFDTNNTTANTQIWLDSSLNSLTMDWTPGAGSIVWDGTSSNFTSLQKSDAPLNVAEKIFRDGDKVHISNGDTTAQSTVILADGINPLVSGLVVGRNSDGVIGNGTVMISGQGNITARLPEAIGEIDIIGKFVGNSLAETGKLQKFGDGRLILATDTANVWNEGTEIHGGTIELAGQDVLGVTGESGPQNGVVNFVGNDTAVVSRKVQTARNRFIVNDGISAKIGTEADTERTNHLAIEAGAAAIAASVAQGGRLTLDAAGGDIAFIGNGTDIRMSGNAALLFTGDENIYLNAGIREASALDAKTVTRKTGGFTQIAADSEVNAVTNIENGGTFRVVGGKTYGGFENETFFNLGSDIHGGTLAGMGTIKAGRFTINGNISPDKATLSTGNETISAADKAGTLTLQGNVLTFQSAVNPGYPATNDRDGFHFDYDIVAANATGNTPTTAEQNPVSTQNDLLAIRGMDSVKLQGGVVNLRTDADGLKSGWYLIVDSTTTITDKDGNNFADGNVVGAEGKKIDGINNYDSAADNGVLWGKINGEDIRVGSPRREIEVKLLDYNGVADSQIWFEVKRNTLTMTRTAGGVWNATVADELWKSEQSNTIGANSTMYEYVIERGDYARIFNPNAGSFTVTGSNDQILSGLQLGHLHDGGDVVIDGDFGIRTETTDVDGWITGIYVGNNGGAPQVPVDGKLIKTGGRTATFANTGTNLFEQGIELHGGTLSFGNAKQLTVGAGQFLTFVDNASLRADTTTDLVSDVVIDLGVTGTLHADRDIALLLQNTLSGAGHFEKTGDGIVQLGPDSFVNGNAGIKAGTLRVLSGRNFNSNAFTVDNDASLQGGGSVHSETIVTINGRIGPDAATLTTADIKVPEADKFGTLTLNAPNVVLDGFAFDYDLGTAYAGTGPSSDPTGDLLKINGITELVGGHISFRGELGNGRYLIVDADSEIDIHGNPLDGIAHADGILTASLNGNILTNDTPRHELVFNFENGRKQIWLEAETNTLYMNWTGGTGNWNNADRNWESTQTTLSGVRADTFRGGDFVAFADTAKDSNVTIADNAVVAGLDTNTDKNVTFAGSGGVTAKLADSSMVGEFVRTDGSADPAKQQFNTTGLFRKNGTGTTTFENTGGNLFEQGVELYRGTVEFGRADQLRVGNGKQIAFKGDSTLRPTASLALGETVEIDDNVTGTFDTANGVVFRYDGTMKGSMAATFAKTGEGTVNLGADSPDYRGAIEVAAGTLGVYNNYGNSKSFTVADGATLTGSGTIGARNDGVIRSGGTLAPRGYTAGNPAVTHLTVDGNLHFDAGSRFDVTISQNPDDLDAEGKMAPVSDYVKVRNGNVEIDSQANLNVEIDYWNGRLKLNDFNEEKSNKFTVIDASEGTVRDGEAQFALNLSEILPRGIKLVQGWQYYENGWLDFGDGWLYQLWFEDDPGGHFEDLCPRHNRNEIGKNLDQLVREADPALKDLILHLSAPCFSTPEVCEFLDQLHGDLRANSLMMAMKTPWRSPFNRLDAPGVSRCCDPCAPVVKRTRKYQLWGESFGRYDDVRNDGNAHRYTINRMGVTVGADARLSHRTVLGLAFNYSDPTLRQATGKAEMDDYEIGLYGLTRLNRLWELKYYAGYSHQRYDISRRVYIPECGDTYPALDEHFRNKTGGDALAMSFELIRTFQLRRNLRLLPAIAFDFNQAWQKGYRESGGLTALEYGKTTLERMMLRLGVGAEYAVRNNIDLNARIQYATQLNSNEYPRSLTRFANSTVADQRYADIWGTRIGRDYLNLGIGLDWKPARLHSTTLFVNYDADIYNRATIHSGQFGFVRQW